MDVAAPTDAWTGATPWLDVDHEDVQAFVARVTAGATTQREVAAAVFTAVRDEIRYDPYASALGAAGMTASAVLAQGRSWCAGKAVLLVAAYRAAGLRAALGFADVRNHLSSGRLDELMGTDVFAWHGYAVVEVDGAVHKASPAFNRELCERFGVEPLAFDGTADALLHAFDGQGRRHMEYVRDRGVFTDLPWDAIVATFAELYPRFLPASVTDPDGGLDDDQRPAAASAAAAGDDVW